MLDILWTDTARSQYLALRADLSLAKRRKAVKKCLELLASNPRHPGLHTHQFTSLGGSRGEKVFEAYAEQSTPAAYRVFWYYGPGKNQITLLAMTPHP